MEPIVERRFAEFPQAAVEMYALTAYHEAGHRIVGLSCGWGGRVEISLSPDPGTGRIRYISGRVAWERSGPAEMEAIIALAGMMAEAAYERVYYNDVEPSIEAPADVVFAHLSGLASGGEGDLEGLRDHGWFTEEAHEAFWRAAEESARLVQEHWHRIERVAREEMLLTLWDHGIAATAEEIDRALQEITERRRVA